MSVWRRIVEIAGRANKEKTLSFCPLPPEPVDDRKQSQRVQKKSRKELPEYVAFDCIIVNPALFPPFQLVFKWNIRLFQMTNKDATVGRGEAAGNATWSYRGGKQTLRRAEEE